MQKYFPIQLSKRENTLSKQEMDDVVDFLVYHHSILFDRLLSYKDPAIHRLITLLVYLATTYHLHDDFASIISSNAFYDRDLLCGRTETILDNILRAYYCDEFDDYQDYKDNLQGWSEYHDCTRQITDFLDENDFIVNIIQGLVELCQNYNINNG